MNEAVRLSLLALGGATLSATALVVCASILPVEPYKPPAAAQSVTPPPVSQPAPAPEPEADAAPEGWDKTGTAGIFYRFCDKDCPAGDVIGDAAYNLVEVWCRDRACGDIYGRVNLLNEDETVVGWTNDSGYGDIGQKVVLTFSSHNDDYKKVQITELKFRS